MSAVMEIDGYAFMVEGEKSTEQGDNLMLAMFSFDRLQSQQPPIHFLTECPTRDVWMLFLLNHLAEFYGVQQADILRDWAEYNALPGSKTYYRLKELIAQASGREQDKGGVPTCPAGHVLTIVDVDALGRRTYHCSTCDQHFRMINGGPERVVWAQPQHGQMTAQDLPVPPLLHPDGDE
jgi:hypothetical protein